MAQPVCNAERGEDPLIAYLLEQHEAEKVKIQENPEGLTRMSLEECPVEGMHGLMHQPEWEPPIQVLQNEDEARPGYTSMAAHEYNDDPWTLEGKVALFAELLRTSENAMAYTGAGISTSAGINDYATKSKDSQMHQERKQVKSGFDALPSLGHRVLTELFHQGHLKHWVQQNHDGLPQKAGFPQNHLNEIHGSWFDPSNPVIPMSGTLRTDLSQWMEEWENKTDLTIAMGTSLCGMNADSCVEVPSLKYKDDGVGHGSVIVGLQRTALDEICSIRFYCRIDLVVALLARELGIVVPEYTPYVPDVDPEAIVSADKFKIPYNKKGLKSDDPDEWIVWDLNEQSQMKVVSGPGKKFKGRIIPPTLRPNDTHYKFRCPKIREGSKEHGKLLKSYVLGKWWVEMATKGLWHQIPIVNTRPVLQKDLPTTKSSRS